METEKIRVLLQVLELGTLSAAAEKLGYTPSGLSRSIASLEQETGLTLLIRERRGVRPTTACEEMLPSWRRVLAAQEQADQALAALLGLDRGRLRIGSSYGSYLPMLARLVSEFSRQWPGIRVELFEGTSSELGDAVADGQADLALISRRSGDFEWIGWKQDQLMAVLPTTHPLAGESAFPLERFAGEAFIEIHPDRETDNSRLFRQEDIVPRRRFSCGDTLAALSMVEVGLGITLVNALLLESWRGNTVALPLDPPCLVEIGVACAPKEIRSPAAEKFLSLLRQVS
jgi:DNA-binding transcriptional LysR family regulator